MLVLYTGILYQGVYQKFGFHTWSDFVIEFLVLVHPHVDSPQRVMVENFDNTPGPGIGGHLTENVTHAGTRGDEDLSPTHPHLEIGQSQARIESAVILIGKN